MVSLLCACGDVAAVNLRHGLADHPTCQDCAEWWHPDSVSPLLPEAEYARQLVVDAGIHLATEAEVG